MPFSLIDLIIFISLAQGLIFGAVILKAPIFKDPNSSNLAYTIIMVSIIGLNEWLSSWDFDEEYYFIDFFGDDVPWMLLFYVPIVLYFLRATAHPWSGHKRLPLLLGIPFAVFLCLNIYIDLDVDFELYAIPEVETFMQWVYGLEFVVALVYAILLNGFVYTVLAKSSVEGVKRKWLRQLYYIIVALVLLWLISFLLPMGSANGFGQWDYALWGGVSCFIYWLIYQGLVQGAFSDLSAQSETKATTEVIEERATPESGKPEKNRTIDPAYKSALEILFGKQQLYRDPNLSRDDVAEALGISSGYLSQVIREVADSNFTTYVNTFRVEAVKLMLKDDAYASFSLLAIGQEAGFKSKSAFYNTFKKHTGMTPSAYQRSAHSSTSDN